ncbi:ATP-dependent DNA helicase RecQ-like [Saccostrea cucullata]|uniref:ATP-dependent DNA helicase RecQ-like n=1 Tax=Saccostrea cuccullata TaxID=36930 RepID=UPI002ED3715C
MGRVLYTLRSNDANIRLREEQESALLYLIEKKGDLLVNLPVGFGKSLIFHLLPQALGANKSSPVVIVISPLNIIHKDQIEQLKSHGISACRLNICSKVEETTDESHEMGQFDLETNVDLKNVANGQFSVVLCHPEALLNTRKGYSLLIDPVFRDNVVSVVIDECHIIEKWGDEFRTAYKKLGTLKVFFPDVPFVGLSGTLTKEQKQAIPKQLCLENFKVIETSPDRPNIFLEKEQKQSGTDVLCQYELIIHKVCDELYEKQESYPVTLLFVPIFYMSEALRYLNSIFGVQNIYSSIYSALCTGQDKEVIDATIDELKKEHPRIRLVSSTSISGMGFDPSNVTQVIHTCPPRDLSQYFQEVGRAGRRGQPARAILYYSKRDIARNLPGIHENIIGYCRNNSNCLRNQLLSAFGFTKDETITGCKCCSHCKLQCKCTMCNTDV